MQLPKDTSVRLAALLSAALPLAVRLSREGTAEEHDQLRGLISESSLSDLSNTLDSLCGNGKRAHGRHSVTKPGETKTWRAFRPTS
jgi:hypothetical protein